MKGSDLKSIVKEKYGQIARQSEGRQPVNCCASSSSSSCCDTDYTIFSENYEGLQGYNPEADLGLGCGLPTEFAGLKPGQHVLDLGSGAGNDCFVARSIVGETGKVTGLDFSDEMLTKARGNAEKLGFANVDFVPGDIERMPFENNHFDVIISNCVLNLVPDKHLAFAEIMRVLKSGGHFCVSDVVIRGELPEKLREDAELYAGCVSGAISLEEYMDAVESSGFSDIQIHMQRRIELPENLLTSHFDAPELQDFLTGETGIFSVTVSAIK